MSKKKKNKNPLELSGVTEDGLRVYKGVGKLTGTYGLPLEIAVMEFKKNGWVVDIPDYVDTLLKDGANIETLKERLSIAYREAYDDDFRDEVLWRLEIYLNPTAEIKPIEEHKTGIIKSECSNYNHEHFYHNVYQVADKDAAINKTHDHNTASNNNMSYWIKNRGKFYVGEYVGTKDLTATKKLVPTVQKTSGNFSFFILPKNEYKFESEQLKYEQKCNKLTLQAWVKNLKERGDEGQISIADQHWDSMEGEYHYDGWDWIGLEKSFVMNLISPFFCKRASTQL